MPADLDVVAVTVRVGLAYGAGAWAAATPPASPKSSPPGHGLTLAATILDGSDVSLAIVSATHPLMLHEGEATTIGSNLAFLGAGYPP